MTERRRLERALGVPDGLVSEDHRADLAASNLAASHEFESLPHQGPDANWDERLRVMRHRITRATFDEVLEAYAGGALDLHLADLTGAEEVVSSVQEKCVERAKAYLQWEPLPMPGINPELDARQICEAALICLKAWIADNPWDDQLLGR